MNKILLLKAKRFFIAFLLLSAFLTMTAPHTFGQELEVYSAAPPPKNYAVTWDVAALFLGGYKFGFDMRLQDKSWIQIIPTAYLHRAASRYYIGLGNDDYYYDYGSRNYGVTSAHGFGIGANYKRFLNKRETIYCHGGIDYSFRRVDVHYYDFIPYEDDIFSGYIYGKLHEKQNFNRASLAACMGIQTPMADGFYIDGYLGIGYKYTFYDESKPTLDKGSNGYGYRGFHPAIGFRIGVAF